MKITFECYCGVSQVIGITLKYNMRGHKNWFQEHTRCLIYTLASFISSLLLFGFEKYLCYFLIALVGFQGVTAYRIDGISPDHMVAVSFDVPFNDLLYENTFNVKVMNIISIRSLPPANEVAGR